MSDEESVITYTLARKEAEYKSACEWFECEYDSGVDEKSVTEQNKLCHGLNEQIKLLKHLLLLIENQEGTLTIT